MRYTAIEVLVPFFGSSHPLFFIGNCVWWVLYCFALHRMIRSSKRMSTCWSTAILKSVRTDASRKLESSSFDIRKSCLPSWARPAVNAPKDFRLSRSVHSLVTGKTKPSSVATTVVHLYLLQNASPWLTVITWLPNNYTERQEQGVIDLLSPLRAKVHTLTSDNEKNSSHMNASQRNESYIFLRPSVGFFGTGNQWKDEWLDQEVLSQNYKFRQDFWGKDRMGHQKTQ